MKDGVLDTVDIVKDFHGCIDGNHVMRTQQLLQKVDIVFLVFYSCFLPFDFVGAGQLHPHIKKRQQKHIPDGIPPNRIPPTEVHGGGIPYHLCCRLPPKKSDQEGTCVALNGAQQLGRQTLSALGETKPPHAEPLEPCNPSLEQMFFGEWIGRWVDEIDVSMFYFGGAVLNSSDWNPCIECLLIHRLHWIEQSYY